MAGVICVAAGHLYVIVWKRVIAERPFAQVGSATVSGIVGENICRILEF
jgi:hypothetical protein